MSQATLNSKQAVVARLNKYVQHKRILSAKSQWFKKPQILASLQACLYLSKLLADRCSEFSYRKVCQMILIRQNDLSMILPCPNNTTYKSQKQFLETLLSEANRENSKPFTPQKMPI